MIVRDVLAEKGGDVITVPLDLRVHDFTKILVEHRIGAVVVSDGKDGVAGIMSERDVIHGIVKYGEACLDRKVEELMTRDVVTCTLDTAVDDIMGMMTRRRIRHLPVIDQGRLVGIVSIGDAVKRRIADIEREANELRNYITA